MTLSRRGWLRALGLREDEIPVLLILEGSWWQAERNRMRLSALEDVRELGFPEMHWGRYRGQPVLYSCVYGAPRAVEPVHVFGSVGTPVVVQIGSCGALQPQVATGDIVLPERAAIGEGASQYYGGVGFAEPDPILVGRAEAAFRRRGFTVHRGPLLTTSALFAQPPERIEMWREAGFLGVDMETSAVFTVARRFRMRAVSLLFAWDELLHGRSFLDEFSPQEQKRQREANQAIFEVALEMMEQPLPRSTPKEAAGS